MIRRFVLVTAVGLAAALPAHARDALSYSHFDIAYLSSEFDTDTLPDKLDATGFRMGAGVGLARYVNFVSEYSQRRFDKSGDEVSFTSVGLGAHSTNPFYQFLLEGTYERSSFDDNAQPSNDDNSDGWGALLGVRVPLPSLELHASAKYLDFGDQDDGTGTKVKIDATQYRGGLVLQLSPWWSLTADYQQVAFDKDTYNEWTAGFRRYFATDTDRRKRKDGIFGGDEAAAAE